MKYIVFKNKYSYLPVLFPDHITHSEVTIVGAVPVSAGFCHFLNGGVIIVDHSRSSESLGLKPNNRDAPLLNRVLGEAGTNDFLISNVDYEDN